LGYFRLFRKNVVNTRELHIALQRGLLEELLSLLEGHRMPEPVAVGSAHVVHADRCDGLEARIDLGRTAE